MELVRITKADKTVKSEALLLTDLVLANSFHVLNVASLAECGRSTLISGMAHSLYPFDL